ncbi:DUF4282 domain-containing protein [Bacillus sp. B15-48]|uniref:DUF4282 domain-containing protein n=1 Tax=Bacillus sp. B15-48 TaxID=1548601 RepID=UPI001EF1CC10|nr:DUF4282 domain-containing protein [Bacillus sp. B15-48]
MQFNKMITPSIIKFVFWIGAGLSVLFGIIQIIAGAASPYGGGIQVISGLFTIVLGPFITRIYCELLIIFFKIQETLQEIKNRGNIEG